jgi:hypothetical protein
MFSSFVAFTIPLKGHYPEPLSDFLPSFGVQKQKKGFPAI